MKGVVVVVGDAVVDEDVVVVTYIFYLPFPLHEMGRLNWAEACFVTRTISSVGDDGVLVREEHTENRDDLNDGMLLATPGMMPTRDLEIDWDVEQDS
ncbi:hypothetical protein TWF718_007528 [Orbilia javanica]|uniref:Uncharacterized protein n=1 Tax=Orbilia javanica TaxID=47235 RepID=A0AAN8MPG2_9PEZI